MIKQRDLIIIGAGLSGTAAAIEAARVGINTMVMTKPNDPGYWSRVTKANHFPGPFGELSGNKYIALAKEKAEKLGVVFHEFNVEKIEPTNNNTYKIHGNNEEYYEAASVILASGVSKDEHFLSGEQELVGKGAFYSVENDAPTLKHQHAVIIGKTEKTVQAVQYLSKFSDKITFVIPSSKLNISESAYKELEANTKIEMLFSSSVKKLNGHEELYSATIFSAGVEREQKTHAVFIYTYNLKPCSHFVENLIEMDKESGRIKINSNFSTSRHGIFASGDLLIGSLQNPVVSIAQGTIAAINAKKYLLAI